MENKIAMIYRQAACIAQYAVCNAKTSFVFLVSSDKNLGRAYSRSGSDRLLGEETLRVSSDGV